MRRMITSKKEQQLLDMTESIFESGVWEIASGSTNGSKVLNSITPGYQYKIYLNIKGSITGILRLETEIGITAGYVNFISTTKFLNLTTTATLDGANDYRLVLQGNVNGTLDATLRFTGTTSANVSYRYLITRSKLYF